MIVFISIKLIQLHFPLLALLILSAFKMKARAIRLHSLNWLGESVSKRKGLLLLSLVHPKLTLWCAHQPWQRHGRVFTGPLPGLGM